MKRLKAAILLLCSSLPVPLWGASVKVNFPDSVEVENLADHSVKKYESKETVETELTQPVLFRIKDRVPVLLVPVRENQNVFQLDSVPLKDAIESAVTERVQERVSTDLDQLLPEIFQIQELVKSRALDEASRRLNVLETRFPKVPSLGFMRASLLFLNGKKEEARALIEKLAASYPNYPAAKEFLGSLRGSK